jgi:hypothetical protein
MTLDELIDTAAADAGMTASQARPALVGALGLLDKHADPDAARRLYEAVDGAEAAARSQEARPRSGGLFGGLMKGAGGLSGAAIADAMGLLDRLRAQGAGKDQLKRLLPAARERIRAAAGRDVLGEAVASVPGLGGLLSAD